MSVRIAASPTEELPVNSRRHARDYLLRRYRPATVKHCPGKPRSRQIQCKTFDLLGSAHSQTFVHQCRSTTPCSLTFTHPFLIYDDSADTCQSPIKSSALATTEKLYVYLCLNICIYICIYSQVIADDANIPNNKNTDSVPTVTYEKQHSLQKLAIHRMDSANTLSSLRAIKTPQRQWESTTVFHTKDGPNQPRATMAAHFGILTPHATPGRPPVHTTIRWREL